MSKSIGKHSRSVPDSALDTFTYNCPCLSGLTFQQCCRPFITFESLPATAEQLMRSRYTAYTLQNSKYQLYSWHPDFRPARIDFTLQPHQWIGLKILSTHSGGKKDHQGQVHFIARYKLNGKAHKLEECSRFKKISNQWFYLEAIQNT